jgi:DNA-binding transcriptional ArsR family regulator
MPPPHAKPEAILDALGNPLRREIIRLLSQQAASVGQLAEQLPISRPAVSKHLRLLERARLVAHDARGTRNVFRLDPRGFRGAHRWLDSFWNEALAEFVSAAEREDPDRE